MELSVIITHYKTPKLLQSCIESVQEDCKASDLNYEIIVTDSEAQKEIEELLGLQFPEVNYIAFKKNVGYAKLVNAGLKKAKGDYILILNSDILIKRGSILTLLLFLKSHSEIGLLGPKLLNPDQSLQPTCFRFYTPWTIVCRRTFLEKTSLCKKTLNKFLIKDKITKDIDDSLTVDWLMGSALMTTREVVNKVGPLDERYFMYFEDVDWAKRFWQNNYQVVYFPKAEMLHLHQRASKKKGGIMDVFTNPLTRIHLMSAVKYFLKWR